MAAVKRNKERLVTMLGDKDERNDNALRAGIAPFLDRLSPAEWTARKGEIIKWLNGVTEEKDLEKAKPVRVHRWIAALSN